LCPPLHTRPSQELIGFNSLRPKSFGEPARGDAGNEVELEEPVPGRDVSQCNNGITVALGVDVGDVTPVT